MGSFTNRMSIQNNTIGSVGPARIAVGTVTPGSPPTARILVFPRGGEEQQHVVRLGETFPVADETWRFADVDFKTLGWWTVTIRRVDEDEPHDPPTGHHGVFELPISDDPARLQPYGRLDPSQLDSLRAALGQELPPAYERWLAETNGVRFEDDHRLRDVYRDQVGVQRYPWPLTIPMGWSLFGVDPEHPERDLVAAQGAYRDPWLSRRYLAIGVVPEGILYVRADEERPDSVWFLPEKHLVEPGPAGHADRERWLGRLGDDMTEFLGQVHPLPPIEVGPDAISYPDRSDPRYWDIPR